ncbi:MAG TPA: hypothetical protein V6D29_06630 [Leptolyngbyaceae cyanobacterium]
MSSPDESRSALDLLTLPEPLQQLVRWMRQNSPFTLTELTAQVGPPEEAQITLNTLIERGFVEPVPAAQDEMVEGDEPRYRMHLSHRNERSRRSALWQNLDESTGDL